jgi:inosine triphosphate pyrophosphatase
MQAKKFPITFITGNKKKLEEFMSIMTGPLIDSYDITNKAIDLEEMQGTPEAIALKKVKLASQTIKGPAMTEDVSLCFNALGGMPGPYIKDFLDKVGREGLHKMLVGFEDKSAYAQCIFAFCEAPDATPIVFVGKCKGTIVAP